MTEWLEKRFFHWPSASGGSGLTVVPWPAPFLPLLQFWTSCSCCSCSGWCQIGPWTLLLTPQAHVRCGDRKQDTKVKLNWNVPSSTQQRHNLYCGSAFRLDLVGLQQTCSRARLGLDFLSWFVKFHRLQSESWLRYAWHFLPLRVVWIFIEAHNAGMHFVWADHRVCFVIHANRYCNYQPILKYKKRILCCSQPLGGTCPLRFTASNRQ